MDNEEEALDAMFPGLASDLLEQLRIDVRDGLCRCGRGLVVYDDGRSLSINLTVDDCRRYEVLHNGECRYVGPRMHMAVKCLLEAEEDRPVFSKVFDEDKDELVSGIIWLLVHGFHTTEATDGLSVELARRVKLRTRSVGLVADVEVQGIVDKTGATTWTASVHGRQQFNRVDEACAAAGMECGEGGTPKEALQALMPVLVAWVRISNKEQKEKK